MALEWYWCLLAIVVYFSYKQLRPWLRSAKLVLSLRGPCKTPIFGNFFGGYKGTGLVEILNSSYEKYGPIFGTWINIIPFVFVLDPKHIQLILGSSKMIHKPFVYKFLENFVGRGLPTNDAPKWKSHRKYIQPYFNLNIIEKFIPSFVECSQAFIENEKQSTEIKITSTVNKYVYDMLQRVVLGIPANDVTTKQQSPFNQGEKTVFRRLLQPWFFADYIYSFTSVCKKEIEHKNHLCEFARKTLGDLKANRRINVMSKWSLLECFLEISENNTDFSEEDIVNEACTFMLAGQDSVGAAVSFALYHLAKHQDIQERVIQEQNAIILHNAEINMATLNEMKYLEQCIKESMRLSPAIPLIGRVLKEDLNLGTHILPAGCIVAISPAATHRLPEYYPNPDVFDPEQFSDINTSTRHPFAFIPFSAGPRNCIAYKLAMLEMKTFLSTILRHYKFYLIPGKEEVLTLYRVTLKARGGIWLKMESRTSAT